ncbi:Gastrula zinc finger protein XlCGF9.1 [Porphyridium purpureum]|uniref:Gastrula zinc finger protein XlCGF9.1 n=1 Tax=Porphyridium purpureum TaxID=35688 RepID=A0A5J4YYR1_PORPP|nr:Gastrula zinc finger protein XlCGF9.1 [Porphyridium purpureum]|eukprot:POR0479..scf209_3
MERIPADMNPLAGLHPECRAQVAYVLDRLRAREVAQEWLLADVGLNVLPHGVKQGQLDSAIGVMYSLLKKDKNLFAGLDAFGTASRKSSAAQSCATVGSSSGSGSGSDWSQQLQPREGAHGLHDENLVQGFIANQAAFGTAEVTPSAINALLREYWTTLEQEPDFETLILPYQQVGDLMFAILYDNSHSDFYQGDVTVRHARRLRRTVIMLDSHDLFEMFVMARGPAGEPLLTFHSVTCTGIYTGFTLALKQDRTTFMPSVQDIGQITIMQDSDRCQFCILRGTSCSCSLRIDASSVRLRQRWNPHQAERTWSDWARGFSSVRNMLSRAVVKVYLGNNLIAEDAVATVINTRMFDDPRLNRAKAEFLDCVRFLQAEQLVLPLSGIQSQPPQVRPPLQNLSFDSHGQLPRVPNDIPGTITDKTKFESKQDRRVVGTDRNDIPARMSYLSSDANDIRAKLTPGDHIEKGPSHVRHAARESGGRSPSRSIARDNAGTNNQPAKRGRADSADRSLTDGASGSEKRQATVKSGDDDGGKRVFLCDVCGSSFARNHDLLRHKRSLHFNLRPFQCAHCSMSFQQRVHMTAHIAAIHEKKKNASCPVCSRAFGTKSNMKKHVRNVHDCSLE